MEKKKKEQWEKDVIKNNVALGIEMVAFVGLLTFITLCGNGKIDETLGLIFFVICLAITLVSAVYGQHMLKCHAVPEKSILEEGDIKSNNFEELMDNVSNNLSDLPRKSYKYEDHLHDPIVLNDGTVYTSVFVQEKAKILKFFIFIYVIDFSKFDLKRDLTIIWNRVCDEVEDHSAEIMEKRPAIIGKRIIYSVCVDKHTEDFQQYLDDNAGKYNKKGNGAFFVDSDDFSSGIYYPSTAAAASSPFSNTVQLEAGICFETQKRYHLVPGSLNNVWHGIMRKWFLEIMKDC